MQRPADIPKYGRAQSETLVSVQCLRGVASFIVVASHAIGGYGVKYVADSSLLHNFYYLKSLGAFGVDMFFVISGFIMVYVSRNFSGPGGAADFAMRRVIRVVPLYWLFTGVFVALLLFWPSIFSTLKLSARHTAESFLFIPTVNNVGDYYPVLGVGWTLNYEMYFYAIFAVLLLAPISRSVMITAVFFLACAIYGYVNPPDGPIPYMLTNQILLEFVLGEFIALWFISGRRLNPRAATIVAGIGLLGFARYLFFGPLGPGRFIDAGIPSALLLLGLVYMERGAVVSFPGWLKKLGDSSYSLYLVHPLVVAALYKVADLSGTITRIPPDIAMLVAMAGAVIAGHLAFLTIEWPMTRWLNGRWREYRSARVRLAG